MTCLARVVKVDAVAEPRRREVAQVDLRHERDDGVGRVPRKAQRRARAHRVAEEAHTPVWRAELREVRGWLSRGASFDIVRARWRGRGGRDDESSTLRPFQTLLR